MGIVIGVIVLVISIGFVVLMAYSEWSEKGQSSAPAPSADPLPAKASSRKKKPSRSSSKKKKR